jgi:hypothetical protein
MRYAWDPEKDALNRRKHGLSLEEGIATLDDAHKDFWIDDRFDYGEERMASWVWAGGESFMSSPRYHAQISPESFP